ncbi:MAG: hypothetical protein ACK595_21245, partial [Planctomycetota bacterium]
MTKTPQPTAAPRLVLGIDLGTTNSLAAVRAGKGARVLRDPWTRAKALLEAESPGVLDANKKLDPAFLADALELAEEVAFVRPEQVGALRARLQQALD